MHKHALIVVVALALALLAGCGSGGSSTAGGAGSTSTASKQPGTGTTTTAARPGPPKARESIQEAEKRIDETASSANCDQVNKLNPLSRPGFNVSTRCEQLQRLATLNATGAAQYGDAGVIEYKLPSGRLAALLVRDSDGLFKVTYEDPRLAQQTIGTPLAKQFDGVADEAVKALAQKDCNAFYAVAFQEFGPSAGPKEEVCKQLDVSPIAAQIKKDPNAKPQLMGGNGTFAFYGLDLPGSFWTILLAKETPSDVVPRGADPLPKGAPTYGYVDAFRTNPPPPGSSGSG